MARQNPISDIKRSVDEHFDAAVGTHVRAVTGAAGMAGRAVDAVRDAAGRVRKWWNEDGRGPRRTEDVRLPNEGRQGRRNRSRARSR